MRDQAGRDEDAEEGEEEEALAIQNSLQTKQFP